MEADRAALLDEIVAMLRDVTGEDEQWSRRVDETSRLEDDLRMESVELAELDTLMRNRYGDRVDLRRFLSELDLDALIALRVGDLMALVAQR